MRERKRTSRRIETELVGSADGEDMLHGLEKSKADAMNAVGLLNGAKPQNRHSS